ncbi:brain tumor protein [Copidosoma floridanum]|uniref:brain tumor protein n=1 Tax=Copidosoma floridanum TaxID=29053 RepID=UPI000C6F4AA9|nr:brain tumor protein [Copidosoma floridanum]
MASPTPSLESRANSLGSLASLSPLTVSDSSPPASDSAICDVDSCDLCLDAPLGKPGDAATSCPRCCRLGTTPSSGGTTHHLHHIITSNGTTSVPNISGPGSSASSTSSCSSSSSSTSGTGSATGNLLAGVSLSPLVLGDLGIVNGPPSTNGAIINGNTLGCSLGLGVRCTGCKSTESDAVARCYDCANFLCPNCVMAHQFMHCFEGHRVLNLGNGNTTTTTTTTSSGNNSNGSSSKPILCARHKGELLKYYCRSCTVPICKECTLNEHPSPMHDYVHVSEIGPQLHEAVTRAVQECRGKAGEIRSAVKAADHGAARLQVQYHKAQNEINETFQFYRSMLEERKQELLKELESIFSAKQISLGVCTQKANEMVDKIQQTCDFVERVSKCSNVLDVLMVKKLLDGKLQMILNYSADVNAQTTDLEFVSNYQAIQVGVRNTFGYVRSSSNGGGGGGGNGGEGNSGPSKQPPIARPSASHGQQMGGAPGSGSSSASSGPGSSGSPSPFENTGSVISKRFSSANSLGPFSTSISELHLNGMNNPYEKWSNGGSDPYPGVTVPEHGFPIPNVSATGAGAPGDSVLDLTSKLMPTAAIFPLKSQIKRQKMIYHCKFGEFGIMEGQFTEPSGVAVNAQNDIIVADTNNHRIQIFDKEGRFKFQFGECGKRDGQLLYPNRVAVVRTSGDIIVTERSPTHQIQIYNQYGQFVRKFGANILQHPRGVTVDSKGRIVVVECKVMRVIIFDQMGNVLQKFGCSKHLEFPNGVVVNDKQEIFISDNRAHCVKVFNYEGAYIRQIGGEGITNYPIGVGINSAGEILIADNHNNFNLTIFTQDGNLVSALESKVKHAQCFDVALMDDGSVVLASKDYRLYIYRYVQVPPIGI